MKIERSLETCHPLLCECTDRIATAIIHAHNVPMRLFEAGRTHDRHNMLIQRGKTHDVFSRHLFNLSNNPPLFCTAVDYVHYDQKWSWNLRDSTVQAWFTLFGNLVLDLCPELEWGGQNRKATNYCHFQLRRAILIENLDKTPCVTP